MRIVLVWPQSTTAVYYLQAPLECMYLASPLAEEHEVRIYDQNVDEESLESVARNFAADIICVLFNHVRSVAAAYDIAKQLQGKGYVLIAGGKYPTANPQQSIKAGYDIVFRGNVERSICEFLLHLDFNFPFIKAETALPPGYYFKNKDGSYTDTGSSYSTDTRYVLNRSLLPKKYHARYTHGFLKGSRGCIFTCAFCTAAESRFKLRDPKLVVDELEYIVKEEGHKAIHFGDDIFTHNAEWVIEICRQIIDRKIVCNFSVNSRADIPKKNWHIFKWMYKAGCKIVAFGIESADQKVLQGAMKGLKVSKIMPVVEEVKKAGIGVRCNLIIGLPGATYQDHLSNIDLMEAIQPHQIVMSLCMPYPGTKMGEDPIKYGIHLKNQNWEALMERDYCNPKQLGDIIEYQDISTEEILQFTHSFLERLRHHGYITISEDRERAEIPKKIIKTFLDKAKLPMLRNRAGQLDRYSRSSEMDWVL